MKSILLLVVIANLAVPGLPAAEPGFTSAECAALLSVIAKAELHRREESIKVVRERVNAFTRDGGAKLVEKFGGGADVRTTATSSIYDAGDAVWLIDVEVRWADTIPVGARYAVQGRLRVSGDGRHCSFTKLWSSQSVKDHAMFTSSGTMPLVLPPLTIAIK